MVLEPGGDPVEIQWFFTDKPPMTFDHIGASRNWLSDREEDTSPGEVKGADRPWVNGAGPSFPCCDVPFGTADAWMGKPFQPKRRSCQFRPNPGTVGLRIFPSATLVNPKKWQGNLVVNLQPKAQIRQPIYWYADLRLKLQPVSKWYVPVTYPGTIWTRFQPDYVPVTPRIWKGNITLSLFGGNGQSKGTWRTGITEIKMGLASTWAMGISYPSVLEVDLQPTSDWHPNNPIITYGPCSSGMFAKWSITVAGVAGTGCTIYNGTFTLVWDPVSSQFLSTATWPATGEPLWSFGYDSGANLWELSGNQVVGSTNSLYTISSGTFNCLASNIWDFGSTIGCTGWPATITMVPL